MKKCLLAVVTALIFAVSCTKKPADSIIIATKPMTEQFILAEMLRILIEEHTELDVIIKKGIGGGTANIHPALVAGEFDLYPEYTGTAWNYILKRASIPNESLLFAELASEYQEQYDLEWVGLYGFNNTYGLVVREDIANEYNIHTYSDLSAYSKELIFGGEYDFFEREDGYEGLSKAYDYNFRKQVDLDIGLKYQAINNEQIDVMTVSTTDAQLSVAAVKLLTDDKHFYQSYYCGTVVRAETLKQHPELRKALSLMNNLLTNEEIMALNYAVEAKAQDERMVAESFLRVKGLIK
ncbi:MAG: hypothetical protein LBV04_01055 [Deferribacteraceae bacterium]|nr:hypothetical protein [Deferribacteraceae bacterium]